MGKEQLNILYISHSHPPDGEPLKNLGGMQRVSMQLMNELERRDDVNLHTKILKTSWKGIALRTTGFLADLIWDLPSLVRRVEADIILFSSMVTASVTLATRGRVNIPMVTITHGQDVTLPNVAYQWLVPRVFERLDGVISVSRATKAECVKRGMEEHNVRALANGFDMADQMNMPAREQARKILTESLDLDLDGYYLLLTVGRMVKRKGHERFIRNILPLIESPVKYLIIGDGPEEEAVRKAIRETGLQQVVCMAGRQPDAVLQNAYAVADLFMMPNVPVEGDMEGFGIVLLEANLAATPAVASDLEGIKDVIENGKNGYRIPVGDDRAFARQVEELLQQNDLNELGKKAEQYVESRFSWKEVAGRYVEFLREIAGKSQ